MRVILFRHGPAGSRDPSRWPNDRLRPLTPRGESRTRAAARGIVRLEKTIARVITSPLVRADETARLMAEAAEVARVEKLDALAPGGSYRRVIESLAGLAPDATVVLVGHEPDLGKLAGTLLFGAPAALPIKKAGACLISFEDAVLAGAGTLAWFLPPRMLRRAAHKKAHA